MTGLFITFEGPEGAGKSTLAARLAEALRRRGVPVLATREPGGTVLGERVRAAVLGPEVEVTPMAEFLLFSASRAQLVSQVIRPALQDGQVVLCDRYADSSLAYQGGGRGLPLEFLNEVTWEATGGLRPHLTFLLDIDSRAGLERAATTGGKDRIEADDLAFHERVRQAFLLAARNEPERFVVLDATRSPDDLVAEAGALVTGTLSALGLLPPS
ncbi:MAG TPA: dTMP kinase [Deinococcales bacterium]|nr:dTMP kinase [Deinococcales bacterium]